MKKMIPTVRKYPLLLLASLLMTASSYSMEQEKREEKSLGDLVREKMFRTLDAEIAANLKEIYPEEYAHQEAVNKEAAKREEEALKAMTLNSIKEWDEALKRGDPCELEKVKADKKKEFYWALPMGSVVFTGDYSPLLKQTLIDTLIEYVSNPGNEIGRAIEISIVSLGCLEGDLRSYFMSEIRKEGWFCHREPARLTFFDYTKPQSGEHPNTAARRAKFRHLFEETFESSSHYFWNLKDLKKSLRENPYYSKMDIHGQDYTSEDLEQIGRYVREHNMRSLVMDKNVFDKASMDFLAKGMEGVLSLQSLYFHNVNIKKQEGFPLFVYGIGNLNGLNYLNMRHCHIDDTHHDSFLYLISESKNLKNLDIGFNHFSEKMLMAILSALKANQFAGKLNLCGLKYIPESMSENSIIVLADLIATTPITHLDMGWSKLTNESLVLLLHGALANPHLVNLDIGHNSLNDPSGAEALAQLLQQTKTLQNLDIGNLKIHNEHMVVIAKGLAANTSLTTLHLGGDNYGVEGGIALAGALSTHPHLKNINFFENNFPDDISAILLTCLRYNTSIEHFKLYRSTFGDKSAKVFKKVFPHNKTLKELELSYLEISDAHLEVLSQGIHPHTNLKKIHLSGNKLKNTLPLAQAVWRAPQVKEVHFGGYDGSIERKAALAFAYMKQVRKLDCDLPGYNDGIMRQLAMEKPEKVLRSLEPVQFYPESGTLRLNFSKLKSKKSFKYFYQKDEQYQNIDKLYLKGINFYTVSFDYMTRFLASRTTMKEICVDGSKLPDKYTSLLLKNLKGSTSLKKLSIQGNEVGPQTVPYLKKILQRISSLEELDLSKVTGTLADIKMIAEGLKDNKTLKILRLRQHNLRSLIHWVTPVWHHPSIEKLDTDYFWRISFKSEVGPVEFIQILKDKTYPDQDVWEKVTAITLAYMKKHKKVDINFRSDKDKEILPYVETYAPDIEKYLKSTSEDGKAQGQ